MVCKRLIDLVLGTVLAALALPVIAVLACVVAGQFRAWPFFTQARVNQRGELFTFVKLRTLPPSTSPYALKETLVGLRVPRLARTLRELHLDELPQLFLVPLGRMSLVGPRPKMPDEHEPVPHRHRAVRMRVPQGCTGLWQIGAHRDGLPSSAPEYDEFYVSHATVRLDLWILWRTCHRMLGVGRLVTLDDVPLWVLPRSAARQRREQGRSASAIAVSANETVEMSS